ncbi:O-antigen polymerase [Deinococcus knuensis]|uniref:O-antigen polymerase n=1 Tax=Deinococcus knuensis TaxID=1837380 RepID=UPI00166EB181|nr:O-antigen polymerase [Deinococcus knuensis]
MNATLKQNEMSKLDIKVKLRRFASLFAAFAAILLAVAPFFVFYEIRISIMVSLIGAFIILPILIRIQSRETDIFEPIYLSNIYFFMMFYARPFVDEINDISIYLDQDVTQHYFDALLLVACGIFFYNFSYILFTKFKFKAISTPQLTDKKYIRMGDLCSLLGIVLFMGFLYQIGGVNALATLLSGRAAGNDDLFIQSSGYFYFGLLLLIPAASMYFIIYLSNSKFRRSALIRFLIVSFIFLGYYSLRGTRSNMLPFIISLFALYFTWLQQRIKKRYIIVIIYLVFALFGFLRDARVAESDSRNLDGLISSFINPIGEIADLIDSPDNDMIDGISIAIGYINELKIFEPGVILKDIAIRTVPRKLYPDKGIEMNDRLVQEIWPIHAQNSRAAPAFSIFLAMFMDSGYYSLIFLSCLTGSSLYLLWYKFGRSRSIGAIMFYCLCLGMLPVLLRGTFQDTLGRSVFIVLPSIVLIAIERRVNVK